MFACHPPSQRDVVIFSRENPATGYFVKRVVGEPGDLVEIPRGQIFINGTALDEPYITALSKDSSGPALMPTRSYYVLGDNRSASSDSRGKHHVKGMGQLLACWSVQNSGGIYGLTGFVFTPN